MLFRPGTVARSDALSARLSYLWYSVNLYPTFSGRTVDILKLSQGNGPQDGVLVVMSEGEIGTVCSHISFRQTTADTVCRLLGFG